jgi:hypothetical protein
MRRFTPEENARIREWYAAYMPVSEMADRLGRSIGVVNQKIFGLRLHRKGGVLACLKWAPEHLKSRVLEMDAKAFRAACHAWRDEYKIAVISRRAAELARVCADIDRNPDLDRDAKIRAKRMAGVTLQVIGDQYGLTHERVRQLTTPGWKAAGRSEKKSRRGHRAKTRGGEMKEPMIKHMTYVTMTALATELGRHKSTMTRAVARWEKEAGSRALVNRAGGKQARHLLTSADAEAFKAWYLDYPV